MNYKKTNYNQYLPIKLCGSIKQKNPTKNNRLPKHAKLSPLQFPSKSIQQFSRIRTNTILKGKYLAVQQCPWESTTTSLYPSMGQSESEGTGLLLCDVTFLHKYYRANCYV